MTSRDSKVMDYVVVDGASHPPIVYMCATLCAKCAGVSVQQSNSFAFSCRAGERDTEPRHKGAFTPFSSITPPPPLQMLFGREIRKRNSAAEMMAK